MNFLKTFEKYRLILERVTDHQFVKRLEELAYNRLLTPTEQADYESSIYDKISIAAFSIYDKKFWNKEELNDSDYELALVLLAQKLKRTLDAPPTDDIAPIDNNIEPTDNLIEEDPAEPNTIEGMTDEI